uniref:Epithelial cell transforming 2 n=1 Tax=Scleropages formosus TaxID=113540 RepID=A0A8C9TN60_SCLFO
MSVFNLVLIVTLDFDKYSCKQAACVKRLCKMRRLCVRFPDGPVNEDNAVKPRFLQNVRVMEVPAVKINAGGRDGEVGKRLVKSIVNMDIAVPHSKAANVQEVGDRENAEFETVFALTDFEGPDFEYLYKNDHRIVGPPALLHCAGTQEPLPFSSRPLYSTTMMNLSLCFTGFRDKEEVVHLVSLVHHMGGTIRKDFSSKVTHLIARSTHGEKYRLAVCMGTPILTPDWIRAAWERRDEVGFGAGDEEFRADFKVPPFQDCVLSFLGFSDEERNNMQERTLKHGGHYLEVQAERCTHVVVEENEVEELPFLPSKRLYVVKQEVRFSGLSCQEGNRRRQVRDTLAQLAKETEISPFPPHRPHSVDLSSSTDAPLDIADAPESSKAPGGTSGRCTRSRFGSFSLSPRSCTRLRDEPLGRSPFPEMVGDTAGWARTRWSACRSHDLTALSLQLFKHPLEKEGLVGGPILAQEEIKTIFGSIPDIYDVHSRIKTDLEELVMNWAEDKSVGDIILRYSKDLMKAYPQFVNFLEMSKDTIVRCEKQKPRFHAFLKINQAKPECGRQTLVDLLIRPVQRLPSVALLLNDIRKLTSEDNPDKVTLGKAIESLKEVMTHINEDKRKTEGQKQIFDVVYEVDGCPANLLSSHRTLVHRAETVTLGEKPCDRGENVTLFLFNDCLEIARKRHKVMGPLRSPLGPLRPPASLKHVALMPLSQIRRVLDLQETDDCRNAFALVVRLPTEQDNQLFSFQLSGEDTDKAAWLRMLCRHVADTICKADAEDLIRFAEPESIQVSTKDVDSTLSRASRAIKKTSKKVTRAFSFTKTPKRVIQRAIMASSSQHDADHMVHFTGTVALNVSFLCVCVCVCVCMGDMSAAASAVRLPLHGAATHK